MFPPLLLTFGLPFGRLPGHETTSRRPDDVRLGPLDPLRWQRAEFGGSQLDAAGSLGRIGPFRCLGAIHRESVWVVGGGWWVVGGGWWVVGVC